jgi:Fe/S biogenesis protein NfuA
VSTAIDGGTRSGAVDLLDRIERSLDGIRPYIASHRGTVEVIDFDPTDGRLVLRLGGTCQGCSAATVTLRQGIETRMREAVPEVRIVEAV